MRFWWAVACLILVGCATAPTVPPPMPIPDDLGGWTMPQMAPVDQEPEMKPKRKPGPAEKHLKYIEGDWMKVDVPVGVPLTFEFESDEHVPQVVYNPVVLDAPEPQGQADTSGDAWKPWTVQIGKPGTKIPVVHVIASAPNLTLKLTIETSKRRYLLQLRSVAKSSVAVVRWEYPPEEVVEKPRLLPDHTQPQDYHVGYAIQPSDPPPAWTPRQVVDNGRQTFILFPPHLRAINTPMMRLFGPKGPEMANPLMVGSVLRLDHLVDRGVELRLGTGETAELVRITRQEIRTIHCPPQQSGQVPPGECPAWPPTPQATPPR